MNAAERRILDNYIGLMKGLSSEMKLQIIENLKDSLVDKNPEKSRFKSAFGSWKSEDSAEEIIEFLKSNRATNRQIEQF